MNTKVNNFTEHHEAHAVSVLPPITNNVDYDLAVAYRICPRISTAIPPIFSDNKRALADLCLRSFKAALGNLRVKMFVIMDNCPVEYEELFTGLWSKNDLNFTRLPGIGNKATFAKQIQMLVDQNDARLVYFAEDDYFYLPGCFPLLLEFARQHPDADFLSPYDHPDHYTIELHAYPREIRNMSGHCWRPCPCTTCTFLTTQDILRQTRDIFLSYSKGNTDVGMWMGLTKAYVFHPFKIARWIPTRRYWGASAMFAWYFGWRQILFGKKYKLWIPMPSVATHMVQGLLAPAIEWDKEFQARLNA